MSPYQFLQNNHIELLSEWISRSTSEARTAREAGTIVFWLYWRANLSLLPIDEHRLLPYVGSVRRHQCTDPYSLLCSIRHTIGCSMSGSSKIAKIPRMSSKKYMLPPTVRTFSFKKSRGAPQANAVKKIHSIQRIPGRVNSLVYLL